jgi:hypothetical protein
VGCRAGAARRELELEEHEGDGERFYWGSVQEMEIACTQVVFEAHLAFKCLLGARFPAPSDSHLQLIRKC